MYNYLFIILDRYDSSKSSVVPFKSKMSPLQAFRFAYLENTDLGEEQYFEEEVYPKIKVGDSVTSYDEEEYSFLLVKH